MRKVTRRQALKGTVALATCTAVAGMALASGEDGKLFIRTETAGSVAVPVTTHPIEPLIELGQLWQARLQVANAIPDGMSWEDWQPHFDAVANLEVEIRETPAKSFAGLAVKLRLYAHYTSLFDKPAGYDPDWTDELQLAALRDAARLAGEG